MSEQQDLPAGFTPSYDTCSGVSQLCPVQASIYGYRPALGPNVLFAALHTILFVVHLFLGFRMKGYALPTWLTMGIGLQMVGWYARVALYQDVWNFDAMAASLAGLIISPSFVNAAISVTWKHIIIYCGEQHSKLIKAKWYPVVFIGTDFVSIFIQAIGAGMSSGASAGESVNTSLLNVLEGILIAGVVFRLANMIICGAIIVAFAVEYRRHQKSRKSTDPESPFDEVKTVDSRASIRLKSFTGALTGAYVAIIARCAYRVPEMVEGWGGSLTQNETYLLVLDGTILAIAVICLTVGHPMFFFAPMMRQPKPQANEKGVSSSINEEVREFKSGSRVL
ncbi:Putative RTA-like protein [Septoria linicola]|uniref:RTA-like protein n=1 Tax=Septoria linicola TaxID=215465 RepID=A0A9Q9AL29_9PEZI|nr:Putative RTA-like protein [Septoria linicola]